MSIHNKPQIQLYQQKKAFNPDKMPWAKINAFINSIPLSEKYWSGDPEEHLKNRDHHIQLFKLFRMTTNEKTAFIDYVYHNLDEREKNNLQNKKFLDIGPRDGKLTVEIGKRFKEVNAIDADSAIYSILTNNLQKLNEYKIKTKTKIGFFPQTKMDKNYDTILLSHIFYGISRDYKEEIVNGAINSLAKNGQALIVMNGDEGQDADMIEHFKGKVDKIEEFYTKLTRIIETTVKTSRVNLQTLHISQTIEGMMHIAGYLLYSKGVSISQKELRDYCEAQFKNNGIYQLNKIDKILKIEKI